MHMKANQSTHLMDPIAGQFDRLPPHSTEAEMCLLASMMLDSTMLGEVAQIVSGEAFYQADHQIVFDLLIQLYRDNRAVDAVILREELGKRQVLDEIGGTAYLAQILASVPSAAHGVHYAGIVREKHMLRQLIAASNDILRDAYAPHEDAAQVADRAQRRIFEVTEAKAKRQISAGADVLQQVFESMDDKETRGLETGFFELDDMLNGLQGGDVIIVAARPSMGKTAFAMNIIDNICVHHAKPAAIFSMEMSKEQLTQRRICSHGRINSERMRKRTLTADDYAKIAYATAELKKAPLWIDDSSTLTVLELRARARQLKRQHDIQAIMIDYMQLMDAPGVESRQQQISEISRGIKSIARELNVPIVCLSQLNRQAEARDGHRPRMSDLRESGAIEQDADVIMFLHREDYFHQGEATYKKNHECEVIIAKQRQGPTGMVRLRSMLQYVKFENASGQIDPEMF